MRGVASSPLLFLLLSSLLPPWLLGPALLRLLLLHLLPAVVDDGLDAVSVCQQEGVFLSCAHVPDPNAL